MKANCHDRGGGETQAPPVSDCLLLLLVGFCNPLLLSVRILSFATVTKENLCGISKPAKTKRACLQCKPMGMKMISQSAIKVIS